MSDRKLEFENVESARILFGERDQTLQRVEEVFQVDIFARDSTLTFKGSKSGCLKAKHALEELYELVLQGHELSPASVNRALQILSTNPKQSLKSIFLDKVAVSTRLETIAPKTIMQKGYVDAIRKHDIVFGWGPAGTGKTYLAMAMAVSCLVEKQIDRIILTRPAVEAGEKLGFLPGNIAEKVNPYLRPLYDALHDMMDTERAYRLIERGTIEVAPLAFMRGRTLNNSFVILDEAQNTSPQQMKMFLTRIGYNSKVVITGDITQIDLPDGKKSGLSEVITLLGHIKEIGFVEFTQEDVVRHPLVQKIILAYDSADHQKRKK